MFSTIGAVEEEVVLQHDAEVGAVVAQAERARGRGRRSSTRPLFGRLNVITRLMSVLLPEPLEPTSAVVVLRRRDERDVLQHRHAGVVLERHVLERRRRRARRPIGSRDASSSSSVRCFMHLADAVEAREGLGDLRADRGDAHHRRGQQAGEEDVHEEVAEGHRAGRGWRAAADDIMITPTTPMMIVAKRGDAGDGGDGLGDVAEELVDAFREDDVLALFGRVGLHHADAAEALGEAAGDLRVDLAALAEQRPHALERAAPSPPPKTPA